MYKSIEAWTFIFFLLVGYGLGQHHSLSESESASITPLTHHHRTVSPSESASESASESPSTSAYPSSSSYPTESPTPAISLISTSSPSNSPYYYDAVSLSPSPSHNNTNTTLPLGTWMGYSTINVIVAVAGMVLGLVFLSTGYRIYLITYFSVGFIFFGGFVYLIIHIHSTLSLTAAIIIGVSCGVVLGVVTLLIYPIALFFFGAFIGIFLGAIIGVLVNIYTVDIILIVVLPLIGALAAFKFQKFFIILATSFGGAFGVLASIDYFAQNAGGFADFFYYLVLGHLVLHPTVATWVMSGSVLVLTLIGVFLQYRYTGRNARHKPLIKLRCCNPKHDRDDDDSGSESESIEKKDKKKKPKKDRLFMMKALRKKYEEI